MVESTGSDEARDLAQLEEALGIAIESAIVADAVVATPQAQRDSTRALRDEMEQLFRVGMPVAFDISLPLAARDGSVSAEHGIGLEKEPWLYLSRSPAELALMRRIRQALDPRGIPNPGRVLGALAPVQ
jgi:FAD/FMN-containing dehydrogenase